MKKFSLSTARDKGFSFNNDIESVREKILRNDKYFFFLSPKFIIQSKYFDFLLNLYIEIQL